jgi:epoxyqueuosine reductase
MLTPVVSSERLKLRARELGFTLTGIIPAAPSPDLDAYLRWIDAEMHGSMGYLARPDRVERRRDLNLILPGVRSLVMIALDYATQAVDPAILSDPSRGRIAAYAWGIDYHHVMTAHLEALADWLCAESGRNLQQRVYVDTGAILERSHARQAGMGFTGKNTMLIHPRRGSHFFLGELLTDLEFDTYDQPHRATLCGRCARCLAACPTGAFPQPYVLDARRCISYLTIEHKDFIPPDLRPLMGNWVFGCDICQDVCPFQRFAPLTPERRFYPAHPDRAAPLLLDLLALDEAAFRQRYYGSPVYRIKRDRLVRNACVAAGNWGDARALPVLLRLLDDSSPIIRAHAAWGLYRIAGTEARTLLRRHLVAETDAAAIADIEALLSN